jgi:hypothetical protein
MQTPETSQRSFNPAAGLSHFSKPESVAAALSPAGETGGIERATAAFFLVLPLMKRAKDVPRFDRFSRRKLNHVKEWSSEPRLCIQHFNRYFMATAQLAKPKFPRARGLDPVSFSWRNPVLGVIGYAPRSRPDARCFASWRAGAFPRRGSNL